MTPASAASHWGPLADRYENPQPQRRLLALDGGGIRGMLTLELLSEMEAQLRARLGKDDTFRLADYFDYIAGTSTGAIIAAGLSVGMSVQELIDFYRAEGKNMFDKAFLANFGKNLYNDRPLARKLQEVFGQGTSIDLRSGKFKTMLLVVTMNRSTDSPWPISNNPLAIYNHADRRDCNLNIRLYQLVRASTAAPAYFQPETLQWDPNNPEKTFVFVDGGMTPYNNPAFLLYRMATQPAYRLNWPTGEDKLLLVSVGTGSSPSAGAYGNLINTLKELPNNLLYAMQVDQDINCRTVGRCSYGAPIDREMEDLIPYRVRLGHQTREREEIPLSENLGKQFLYVRYNVDLSQESLTKLGLPHIESEKVREMDAVDQLDALQEVGKAGARQISLAHFGSFVPPVAVPAL
ncbi:patatin-like phospholipase family protein [Tellurirhabdus rosea]|uniref:patatin-like phospholipase family protein n=1 Tax=Tellurirhabdus rosea TaxID=2674997 RepID=UPI002253811D|nr:patatin-like phospholipase family protein [Tellurirhabdus rosea]